MLLHVRGHDQVAALAAGNAVLAATLVAQLATVDRARTDQTGGGARAQ